MNVLLAHNEDKGKWNSFIRSGNGSFLQSWEWGDFKERYGQKVWRMVVEDEGVWQAAALVIRHALPGGRCWLYVPRGPIIISEELKVKSEKLIDCFKKIAREEGAVYLKVEPAWGEGDRRDDLFLGKGGGWWLSKKEVQPRSTLVVDLTRTEEELLGDLHQKARYNIRLAEKKGVEVKFAISQEAMEAFMKLAEEIEERGSFHFHPAEYYKLMREMLSPTGFLELATAEYNGEILAVSWLIYFGETVTFAHGASSKSMRQVMAPHLLQWHSIRRAKDKGMKRYDFYGIAPEGSPRAHPWQGITRFKEGFGGQRLIYAAARDLVFNFPAYYLFDLMRRIRHV